MLLESTKFRRRKLCDDREKCSDSTEIFKRRKNFYVYITCMKYF